MFKLKESDHIVTKSEHIVTKSEHREGWNLDI